MEQIARAWAILMARLGYSRYGAVGSDWGTSVSTLLGQYDRAHVVGVHLIPPLVNEWIAGIDVSTVDVPVGWSVFPRELQRPSRRWAARRFTDIRYWSEPPRGGHFAAFEQPELFVGEVRSFFRLLGD